MSNKFQISVTTPDELIYSKEVVMAIIPGSEGEMGILADHAPVITTLKRGILKTDSANHERNEIYISTGFAEVKNNECSILASTAYDLSKISAEEINSKISFAKARLNTSDNEFDKNLAKEEIELNQDILTYL